MEFIKQTLTPDQSKKLLGNTAHPVWIYLYQHPQHQWEFAIGTLAEPGSEKFSLGGFRIVPVERAETAGFSTATEAGSLALGMEKKVYWSKLVEVAGPRGRRVLPRVVGGKCVLKPSRGYRVGESNDEEALNFGITCLKDFEQSVKVHIVTGQDLGHGVLSNGDETSLEFLGRHFPGSILADTSKPTGEGNYYALKGMLEGFGIDVKNARVGMMGCGHVGSQVLHKLREKGAKVKILESSEHKVQMFSRDGIKAYLPTHQEDFLREDFDALVVNAVGGSLNGVTVERIVKNPAIKAICGSENLALADPSLELELRKAEKLFAPTEWAGMMGYLTAVEERLCALENEPFDIEVMLEEAHLLKESAVRATSYCIEKNFSISFDQALKTLFHRE
ncbi:hypothetical protein JNK13_05860 [bacterium]|nr:hypothetical protein [bacterium]